jgi:hypothetical protein
MVFFQGLFFLVLGVGLVLIAWNSRRTGWLPYGPRRFGRDIAVWRHDRPIFYWILFFGYNMAGLWMTVFALRVLVGVAQPLPLS